MVKWTRFFHAGAPHIPWKSTSILESSPKHLQEKFSKNLQLANVISLCHKSLLNSNTEEISHTDCSMIFRC